MLSLDRLYAKETPESTEKSFDVECQESLETKISPCLYRSQSQAIVDSTSDIGWGFHDELSSIFEKYFTA